MKKNGEVKINTGSRVGSWFTPDSKSLKLMKGVIGDDKTVTIHSGNSNKAISILDKSPVKNLYNGIGVDVNILSNPNTSGITLDIVNDDGRTSSSQSNPLSYIVLSHELIHSLHMIKGKVLEGSVLTQIGIDGNTVTHKYKATHIVIPIKNEELRTVGGLGYNQKRDITENMIRREKKINQRNSY